MASSSSFSTSLESKEKPFPQKLQFMFQDKATKTFRVNKFTDLKPLKKLSPDLHCPSLNNLKDKSFIILPKSDRRRASSYIGFDDLIKNHILPQLFKSLHSVTILKSKNSRMLQRELDETANQLHKQTMRYIFQISPYSTQNNTSFMEALSKKLHGHISQKVCEIYTRVYFDSRLA